MRVFMMLICISGMQVTAGNIFTSIGKARYSVFISLVRQALFLPPLILILPRYFGIDGIMTTGPISDAMCVLTAVVLLFRENKKLNSPAA
jgi:Na+-driven multidrug efflux pump